MTRSQMDLVYLGLGSNLGDRLQHITAAAKSLSSIGKPKDCSSVWETSPWGPISQHPFLNCVISFETSVLPTDLVEVVSEIERDLGRKRGQKLGPRTVDIDILLYGTLTVATSNLHIPHHHLHERKFVLLPLSEIAPDLVHPRLQKEVKEMLHDLGSNETCRLFMPASSFKKSIGTLQVS